MKEWGTHSFILHRLCLEPELLIIANQLGFRSGLHKWENKATNSNGYIPLPLLEAVASEHQLLETAEAGSAIELKSCLCAFHKHLASRCKNRALD